MDFTRNAANWGGAWETSNAFSNKSARPQRTGGLMTSAEPVDVLPGAASSEVKQPTVLLFGDSHSIAVHQAAKRRLAQGHLVPVTVLRRLKLKNGKRSAISASMTSSTEYLSSGRATLSYL